MAATGVTSATIGLLTEADWVKAAESCKVKTPSAETRLVVAAVLRERESQDETAKGLA